EGSDPVPAQVAASHLKGRAGKCSIQISWNACYMRYRFEVNTGCLGRFHVESGSLVQDSAADAMPIIPPAKVLLIQPAAWNAMVYYQLRRIASFEARCSRTNAPFSHLLAKQGSCLSA